MRWKVNYQHLLVLGVFVVVHMFMFRVVLLETPAIWRGDAVIAQHELIPIFDWQTQYRNQILQNYTDLTSTDEVRLAYTFWVSWIRHYKILPFALVFANSFFAFMLYGAFYLIAREFAENRGHARFAAFTAAFCIHLMMLYFKLVHFYMLGFGFSFFALGLSLTIRYLFFTQEKSYGQLILLGCVIFFNPSIHYHVLYYFSLAVVGVAYIARCLFVPGAGWVDSVKRLATLGVAVVCLALIPYVLYIQYVVSLQSTPVSDSIPISYEMLNLNSLDVPHTLALETTSIINRYLTGNYIAHTASINRLVLVGMVYGILGLGLLFDRNRIFRTTNHRFVIVFFGVFFLLGAWLSLGYTDLGLSFHDLLRQMAMAIYNSSSRFLDPILTMAFTLVQILRFSHRFDFLQFYVLGIMIAVAGQQIVAVTARYVKGRTGQWSIRLAFLVASIVLIAWGERGAFLSGDFEGFVNPYPIPQDLKEINAILDEDPEGRLFILPTMEIGRVLYDEEQQDYYMFIDKLFIYYLNHPTYYYGGSARPENKNTAFLVYRSILFGEDWWIDVLRHNMNVRYVLYLKNIQPPPSGGVALPTLPTALATRINEAIRTGRLQPRYIGREFALLEIAPPTGSLENVLIDQRWSRLITTLREREFDALGFEHVYVPTQMSSFVESPGEHYLLTTEPERAFFDLYAILHPEAVFRVDRRIAPFDKSLVSSLSYTSVASMFVTLDNRQPYNYFRTVFPVWANIMSSEGIYGSHQETLKIPLEVKTDGDYRLAIRGYSSSGHLTATLDNTMYELERADAEEPLRSYVELDYFTVDVSLTAGSHQLSLDLPGNIHGLMLVDIVLVMPDNQTPDDFEVAEIDSDLFLLDLKWMKITQSDRTYFYEVKFDTDKAF